MVGGLHHRTMGLRIGLLALVGLLVSRGGDPRARQPCCCWRRGHPKGSANGLRIERVGRSGGRPGMSSRRAARELRGRLQRR